MATGGSATAPRTFREATRLNKVQLPSQAVPTVSSSNAGQRVRFDMPRTGFGARIVLRMTGTMTLGAGGAPALADRGPWSIVNRYRFYSNQGGDIHSISGWGAYKAQLTREFGRFIDAVLTSRTYATNLYSVPIAANTANAWALSLEIPVVVNQRDEVGLLLFQNEEATFSLEIAMGSETDAVSGATTPVLTATTWQAVLEWYTVPVDPNLWPQNLRLLYQLLEERLPVTSVGDAVYAIPRGAVLRKLLTTLTLNGARDSSITDVSQFNLLYNQSEVPLRNIPSWYAQYRNREIYGNDLPVGVWPFDWTDSGGWVGLGDSRDLIATPNVADLQFVTTIGSGATLGANNNYQDIVRDQIAAMV